MSLISQFKNFLAGGKVDIRERFVLLREAISGTMSSFYMAKDKRSGEVVGLKVLDLEKTEQLEARFVGLKKPKEGEIALRFKHPYIVKTLEHGVTTENQQYVVMEFLDGPGVNSLIVGRSPLLEGNRLKLLRDAAEAIGEVHRQGFIHRDICPRNLVAAKDCSTLKLIDFGLTVPATAQYLQPGNRTGTANYMAPEVVRRRPTSKRLDVFAFGVTAFELFAFELPWPRGTGQTAMKHGTQEPVDLRSLCPTVHPRVAEAIHACLQSDPDKRLDSMESFLKMIADVKSERA